MFDMMDKKSDQGIFTLRASYLEVYNERVNRNLDKIKQSINQLIIQSPIKSINQ